MTAPRPLEEGRPDEGPADDAPSPPAADEIAGTDRSRITRQLLAVLLVLAALYVMAVGVAWFVAQQQPVPAIDRLGGTSVTLSASNGARLDADTLARVERTLQTRANARGIGDARVQIVDDDITITIPGDDTGGLAGIGQPGHLRIRPVLRTVPAQPPSATAPMEAAPTDAATPEAIAETRRLRQSSDPATQTEALRRQATRCGAGDVLAGNDDAGSPLVTCAVDGRSVYLLGPSIVDGDDPVKDATAQADEHGGNVVHLTLNPPAGTAWAKNTEARIGREMAFALDTRVLGTQLIRAPVTDGRAEVTGDITEAQAREAVAILNRPPLPVSFAILRTEPVPPKPAKSVFAAPEFGLLTAGGVAMAGVIAGLLIATMRESRRVSRQD